MGILLWTATAGADTFRNRTSGEVLHGYPTSIQADGKTIVNTVQKGPVALDLAGWERSVDRNGRNNRVVVLEIDEVIGLEIETAAFEQAIIQASDAGPLFVLIEINSPGGRVDLAQRLCAAISGRQSCPTVAFVRGGKYGGAISAAAAVALSADRIYMAQNTTIGAAAVVTIDENGPKGVKEEFGGVMGEKISSAWQAFMASLAERRNRPPLLAKAMVSSDIEAIEVAESGKTLFIEPADKKPQQKRIKTWNKKGSLLTLTAAEACRTSMADKLVRSRQEVLEDCNAAEAEIVIDEQVPRARKEFERAQMRFGQLSKSLDLKIKQFGPSQTRPKALSMLRDIQNDYTSLKVLARRYPDLHLDEEIVQEQLNSAEALYQNIKQQKK